MDQKAAWGRLVSPTRHSLLPKRQSPRTKVRSDQAWEILYPLSQPTPKKFYQSPRGAHKVAHASSTGALAHGPRAKRKASSTIQIWRPEKKFSHLMIGPCCLFSINLDPPLMHFSISSSWHPWYSSLNMVRVWTADDVHSTDLSIGWYNELPLMWLKKKETNGVHDFFSYEWSTTMFRKVSEGFRTYCEQSAG